MNAIAAFVSSKRRVTSPTSQASPHEQAVVAQRPELATLGAWCRTCGLQRGVEVERLQALPLLAGLERLEELLQLVVGEAGEREVEAFDRRQVGEQAGQQLLVPVAADLVEAEVEEPRLLQR